MKATFSIVIPVYNAGHTLRETLLSVSAQSYPHFEVICVNDGSSDNCLDILNEWKTKNPQLSIQIITQENKGLAGARNTGIQKASNPWIALLDADDIWENNKLETIAKVLQQKDADIVYHRIKTFGLGFSRIRNAYQIQNLKDLLLKGNPIIPSTVVGNSSVFKEFPFDESKEVLRAEDIDLWINLLHHKKRFLYLADPLTLYRETGGMSTDIDAHYACVIHVLEKYAHKGWYSENVLQQAKQRKWFEAGRFYHKQGDFKAANKHYRKAKLSSIKLLAFKMLSFLKVKI